MNWKILPELPDQKSWVVIETSTKHSPKYEVAIFSTYNGVNEWFIPSNDDACDESDVIRWSYIEK